MRLCLCLCASENSIRQIGGFLLIFLFTLLTLMSRVFSLVTLMLCLCASENHSQLYDCDDLDTSFLRPLRKIIWLQSCEQSSYETIPRKVRYDHLFVQMNIAIWHVAESRDISCRSLAFRCTHFRKLSHSCGLEFTVFPSPFAKRETWNKNQIDYKWTGEIGFGNQDSCLHIKLVDIYHVTTKLTELKRNICFNFRSL